MQGILTPLADSTTPIGLQAAQVNAGLTSLSDDLTTTISWAGTQIQEAASSQIGQINSLVATAQTQLDDLFTTLNAEIESTTASGTTQSTACAEQARDRALNTVQSAQEAFSRCVINAQGTFRGLLESLVSGVNVQVNGVADLSGAITTCITTYQADNDGDAGAACLMAVDVATFSAIATSSLQQQTTGFSSSANTVRSGTQTCVNRATLNAQWNRDVNLNSFQNCLTE